MQPTTGVTDSRCLDRKGGRQATTSTADGSMPSSSCAVPQVGVEGVEGTKPGRETRACTVVPLRHSSAQRAAASSRAAVGPAPRQEQLLPVQPVPAPLVAPWRCRPCPVGLACRQGSTPRLRAAGGGWSAMGRAARAVRSAARRGGGRGRRGASLEAGGAAGRHDGRPNNPAAAAPLCVLSLLERWLSTTCTSPATQNAGRVGTGGKDSLTAAEARHGDRQGSYWPCMWLQYAAYPASASAALMLHQQQSPPPPSPPLGLGTLHALD